MAEKILHSQADRYLIGEGKSGLRGHPWPSRGGQGGNCEIGYPKGGMKWE